MFGSKRALAPEPNTRNVRKRLQFGRPTRGRRRSSGRYRKKAFTKRPYVRSRYKKSFKRTNPKFVQSKGGYKRKYLTHVRPAKTLQLAIPKMKDLARPTLTHGCETWGALSNMNLSDTAVGSNRVNEIIFGFLPGNEWNKMFSAKSYAVTPGDIDTHQYSTHTTLGTYTTGATDVYPYVGTNPIGNISNLPPSELVNRYSHLCLAGSGTFSCSWVGARRVHLIGYKITIYLNRANVLSSLENTADVETALNRPYVSITEYKPHVDSTTDFKQIVENHTVRMNWKRNELQNKADNTFYNKTVYPFRNRKFERVEEFVSGAGVNTGARNASIQTHAKFSKYFPVNRTFSTNTGRPATNDAAGLESFYHGDDHWQPTMFMLRYDPTNDPSYNNVVNSSDLYYRIRVQQWFSADFEPQP